MQGMGATLLQGGRFLHLSGDCDKGRALAWLNRQYAMETGRNPVTIAIGDSQNDAAMLEAADHALIIQSPSHPPPELKRHDKVLLSEAFGPQGWNVMHLSDEIAGFIEFTGGMLAVAGVAIAIWAAWRGAWAKPEPALHAESKAPEATAGEDPWLAAADLPFHHRSTD